MMKAAGSWRIPVGAVVDLPITLLAELGMPQVVREQGDSLTDFGPLLKIHVAVPEATAAAMRARGEDVPGPLVVDGLLDTGATGGISLDTSLVEYLRLGTTGRQIQTRHVNSIEWKDEYHVDLAFPDTDIPARPSEPISAANLTAVVPGLGVLLSRNFLRGFVFTYDGPTGTFRLDW